MTAVENTPIDSIGVTSSSDEIVAYIKALKTFEGIRIGALRSLEGFYEHTAHVICFVKEKENPTNKHPSGTCVYMLITKNGPVGIELCQTLNRFWDYWMWQGETIFPDIECLLSEIEYFFEHDEPKHPESYKFEDGLQNQYIFREMRSIQKCNQLKATFGLDLIPDA